MRESRMKLRIALLPLCLLAALPAAAATRGFDVRDMVALEDEAMEALTHRGWTPDYVTVRRCSDLQPPLGREPLVVLGAAKLGATRLIDSLEF